MLLGRCSTVARMSGKSNSRKKISDPKASPLRPHFSIKRSAFCLSDIRVGWTTERSLKFTCNSKQRVSPCFDIHSPRTHPPQKAIVTIRFEDLLVVIATQLVCSRSHDLAVKQSFFDSAVGTPGDEVTCGQGAPISTHLVNASICLGSSLRTGGISLP